MDYLYPQKISIETINISNVILLPNKLAGDLYMKEFYDKYVDVIVCTADGEYPIDSRLKEKTLTALENDVKINLIVIGDQSLVDRKIATKKLLILDDLIMMDFSTSRLDTMSALELDSYKITSIIKNFCTQGKKLKIGYNLSNVINYKKYNPSKFNSLYTLMSGKDVN